MKKTKAIIIIALIVIVAAILPFIHIPKRIQCTIPVANGAGETALLDVDIRHYSSLVLPSYVKGTVSVDEVEYVDYATRFKHQSDSGLFPSDWWNYRDALHNTTFLLSDWNDSIKSFQNSVNIIDMVLNGDDIHAIHYLYMDDSIEAVDGMKSSISFWGPAQNSEEAKQIAESFGYAAP